MLTEEAVANLKKTLDYLRSERKTSIDTCEKLQVALTSVLRLVDVQDSTLSRLQGSSDDLRGYLIRLTADMCQSTQRLLDSLVEALEEVLESVDRR